MALFKRKNFNLAPSLGSRGEEAAIKYLKKSGYKILETNFCNTSGRRIGEIDIIAKVDNELVFVEVKTRTNSNYLNQPLPQENITRSKLFKLNKTANFYLSKNNLKDQVYRFDAIAIIANPDSNTAKLQHIKNIFI